MQIMGIDLQRIENMLDSATMSVHDYAQVGKRFVGSMNYADMNAKRGTIEWGLHELFYRNELFAHYSRKIVTDENNVILAIN